MVLTNETLQVVQPSSDLNNEDSITSAVMSSQSIYSTEGDQNSETIRATNKTASQPHIQDEGTHLVSIHSNVSNSSMYVLNEEEVNLQDKTKMESTEQDDLVKQIVKAAQRGDMEVLKFYLEHSKDNLHPMSPNTTDADGITLVHWAALNNRLATIKYLISIGADPDVPAGDMNATPLLWAARYGLVYVADYLIREAGADYTRIDKNGINILLASVFSSNVMMVVYILWALKNEQNENPSVGLDGLDIADPTGRTALHWAAYQGDFLTVDVLLNAGAKVDLLDTDRFTPLHWGLVNGSKAVVTSLVKAKSNVKLKTGNGRSTWDIASDMKCSSMWTSVLKETNKNPQTGEKIVMIMSSESASFAAFVLPFLTVPMGIYMMTSSIHILLRVINTLIIFISNQLVLKHVIIACLNKGKVNVLKTPFFAGVFSATAYWCIMTWLLKMLIPTFKEKFLVNTIFFFSAIVVVICFTKAMNMDPGYIPTDKEPSSVKAVIFRLLENRKFDSNHFCIYSNIQKPLRSKFSKEKKLNIARFDHYCPWVNNNIGVRNHKVFLVFALALEIGIFAWLNITLQYFDLLVMHSGAGACKYYPHDLCLGSNESPFIFGLFWWVVIQSLWVMFLLLVQSLQISRGYTTYEFSHKHKFEKQENSFSSVPIDDSIQSKTEDNPVEADVDTDFEDNNIAVLPQTLPSNINNTCLVFTIQILSKILNTKLCKMVGLDQMLFLTTDIIQRKSVSTQINEYNFGFTQNWLDFLFLTRAGDSYSIRSLIALPVHGEGNLNGVLVDYYEFYKIPEPA